MQSVCRPLNSNAMQSGLRPGDCPQCQPTLQPLRRTREWRSECSRALLLRFLPATSSQANRGTRRCNLPRSGAEQRDKLPWMHGTSLRELRQGRLIAKLERLASLFSASFALYQYSDDLRAYSRLRRDRELGPVLRPRRPQQSLRAAVLRARRTRGLQLKPPARPGLRPGPGAGRPDR